MSDDDDMNDNDYKIDIFEQFCIDHPKTFMSLCVLTAVFGAAVLRDKDRNISAEGNPESPATHSERAAHNIDNDAAP